MTDIGIQDTERYSKMRNSILVNMFNQQSDLNLEEMTKNLIKIKAIYDEADRVVASYTSSPEVEMGDET